VPFINNVGEKNGIVGQNKDENITWCMRVACWITKGYKHTLRL